MIRSRSSAIRAPTALGALAQARDGNPTPAGAQAGARALAAALGDSAAVVRLAALGAVAAFGPGVRAGWPACDTALVRLARQDPSASARRAALDALTRTRAPGALVQAAFLRGTSDADPDVRMAAVTPLGLQADTTDPGARADALDCSLRSASFAMWRTAPADARGAIRDAARKPSGRLRQNGSGDFRTRSSASAPACADRFCLATTHRKLSTRAAGRPRCQQSWCTAADRV